MKQQTKADLIGIGIGPSNLSTAALLDPLKEINSIFFDCKQEFQWFPGMLFPEATIQVSWLKDLVTLVDPTSRHLFLSFCRVPSNDPGLGVIRHADAGYDVAKDYARKYRLDIKERLK